MVPYIDDIVYISDSLIVASQKVVLHLKTETVALQTTGTFPPPPKSCQDSEMHLPRQAWLKSKESTSFGEWHKSPLGLSLNSFQGHLLFLFCNVHALAYSHAKYQCWSTPLITIDVNITAVSLPRKWILQGPSGNALCTISISNDARLCIRKFMLGKIWVFEVPTCSLASGLLQNVLTTLFNTVK